MWVAVRTAFECAFGLFIEVAAGGSGNEAKDEEEEEEEE